MVWFQSKRKIFGSIWFQHLVFWLVLIFCNLLLIFGLSGFNFNIFTPLRLVSTFISIFYFAVAVYLNLFFLLPLFLKKKKYISFALLHVVMVSGIIALNMITTLLVEKASIKDYNIVFEFIFEFILISLLISVTTFMKFLREWIRFQDEAIKFKEAQSHKLESELKLLRGQINPHFLFNTLNNLYSLSLDKSEKTPSLILKLSDLMRYMLYDCRDNLVSVEKEILFISNYIELERIRVGENATINFEIKGNTENLSISPFLFIPFVENAFKHGCYKGNNKSFINIFFDFETKNEIKFVVENCREKKSASAKNKYSGIGIENVKKRLSLLYPDKHELKITESDNKYKVELIIRF